ncbi:hypothetical protein GR183_08445 [Stappia sp. GBMRC 2046]|uniref:TNase-like domain-containing protein n=1 Tax=Stappia sediminis TaxID=2692190 RepID=A0A7X3S7P0_9HYPH|nr:thermonuclease family protein [Stappia sediminis]MXN64934.1 hypothetical protein [Stappia sediminis]
MAESALALPDACLNPNESGREIGMASMIPAGGVLAGNGDTYLQTDVLAGKRLLRADIPRGNEFAPYMFYSKAKHEDRWERRLGDLVALESGVWLAAELVSSGRALVDPQHSTVDCLEPLLALEAKARAAREGLWQNFTVLSAGDPEEISRVAGHFAVVEGRVRSVGHTRRTHYLNFGYRWSRDFTATIDVGRETAFDAAGVDISALEGRWVRLRGFVALDRGPLLVLSHPAQLEQLTSGSGVGK